jgi:hypothetical protein
MALIDATIAEQSKSVLPCSIARPRLHTLLAYGADLMSVNIALARGWSISAPLPFGLALNVAINAQPETIDDMNALLGGQTACDPVVGARAVDIHLAASQAHLFALAEQDDTVIQLFGSHLAAPEDRAAAQAFHTITSDRAAIAARVMTEQSDVVIGIWDGVTRGTIGGTRHSISAALELGVPVIWVDANNPSDWRILHATETLAAPWAISMEDRESALKQLISNALYPADLKWDGVREKEHWRAHSNFFLQAYRRVEALFDGSKGRWLSSLTQHYERPEDIAHSSGAPLLAAANALPRTDVLLVENIASTVMRRFAWADGVSTYLSDAYRGGMVTSFFLSALAIIGGVAYLPFASIDQKWGFAAFEFVLLVAIVGITIVGRKRRWHSRWFETRRVAEYFRHAPFLLLIGVARSAGRWPRGPGSAWPEWYAIHVLSGIGLPQMTVTSAYLKNALTLVRDQHVIPQRDYHRSKSNRLKRVQHNLDRFSEFLFIFAVVSVAIYLAIELAAANGILPHTMPHDVAKLFTFLGVLFPTLGGAFSGIHYFGDFDRFASISEITAEKLDGIAARTNILLTAPDVEITFARVSDIAHTIDEIVVTEIENWQAVFGGKHITVPV